MASSRVRRLERHIITHEAGSSSAATQLPVIVLSLALPGVPVKVSVLADLVDIQNRTGVKLPFDYSTMDLSAVKRVQATA